MLKKTNIHIHLHLEYQKLKQYINNLFKVYPTKMVRTSGGIRISAGKSAKKSGGGGTGGSGSRSTSSTSSGKSSNKGSNRLPPIPHCEAPSWQKPITNFFNSDASSSKNEHAEIIQDEAEAGCSSKKEENTDENVNGKAFEESKDIIEKNKVQDENDTSEDEQPSEQKQNQEEKKNKNIDINSSS